MKRLIGLCMLLVVSIASVLAQDILNYPLDTINGKIYYRYTVERGIGLYRISKNFGVTQEELLQVNPQIHDGLRYEEVILIPAQGLEITPITPIIEETIDVAEAVKEVEEVVEAVEAVKKKTKRRERYFEDESIQKTTTVPRHRPSTLKWNALRRFENIFQLDPEEEQTIEDTNLVIIPKDTIRLAMLLPLQADITKRTKTIERFYDFYSGALIAIYEVQNSGQPIELFVYDVGKTEFTTQMVLNDSLFPDVDAIIGPAYRQQVDIAANFALQDSTWLLVPFISNVEQIHTNPYLLQFNPSNELAVDTLAAYLAQQIDSVNCVVFEYSESDRIPQSIQSLHQALNKYNIPTTTATIEQIINDSLETSLVADKENIIIFNTDRFSSLETIMPHLLTTHINHPITLLSQYSWQNEEIPLPQIYTSTFKVDCNIEEYEQIWHTYFTHEISTRLPRYDLLGYDLTKYILEMLQQQKKEDETISEETYLDDSIAHMEAFPKVDIPSTITLWYSGIQSDIQFQQIPGGGYMNHTVHVLRK